MVEGFVGPILIQLTAFVAVDSSVFSVTPENVNSPVLLKSAREAAKLITNGAN